MAKTSINIQPVKGGSEQHNRREKALDYVRSDKPHEYWQQATQAETLAEIKARYLEMTGQKMQAKATPIREGVVVIENTTTMKDLKNLASALEARFGIRTFQIAIHKDEGHWHEAEQGEDISNYGNADRREKNGKTEVWKPNLHAHMVFDWSDPRSGKSIKLNRGQIAQMQTLVADTLHMERGVSSDKEHLTAVQFKNEAEISRSNRKAKKARREQAEEEKRAQEAKKRANKAVLEANTKRGALMMRDGGRFLVGSLAYLGGSIAYLGGSLTSSNGRNMAKMTRDNIRLQDEVNALKKQVEDTGKKADAWKHMWNEDRRVQESIAKHVPEVRSLLNLWTRIKTIYRMVVSGEWFAAALDGRKQNYTGPLYLNEQKINTSGGMELYLNASRSDLAFAGRDLQDIAEQLRQEAEKKAQEKAEERQKWEREQEERRETARQEQETRSIGRGFRR